MNTPATTTIVDAPRNQSAVTPAPSDPVNHRRAMLAGIGGLAAGAFLAGKVNAGPLTPPPGPISSTPGPEPRIPIGPNTTPGTATALFRISQPGSYYLAGNVTGESGKDGIEIGSSNVTLDLMGFSLIGVAGSLNGIRTSGTNRSDISILNGSTQGWGLDGVNLSGIRNSHIERIISVQNGSVGIRCGSLFTVVACAADSNAGNGFVVGFESVIFNCVSQSNTSDGFGLSPGCMITNCTAGINGKNGIFLTVECFARGNTCRRNGTSGTGAGIIVSGTGNRIEDNNSVVNRIGVECLATGNFIARNTCSANLTLNWSIAANNKCLVINGVNAPAISGNSGGTSPGSSDPNANYTF